MDKIIKTISNNGHFRAYALDATETVTTAQDLHHTWSTSTVALGRTLIAAQILGANQKGNDKITLRILPDNEQVGPIIAVADSHGNVKGYMKNNEIDYKKTSTGEVIVGPILAPGWFVVVKDMGLKNPYTGQVPLVTGEIGEDLAYYLTTSEQTPSAVGLNVLLDGEDKVKVAGGFLVQVMPDATEEEIARFEEHVQKMPAISQILEEEDPLKSMLDEIYGEDEYKVLEESPLAFKCDCSKERFAEGLASLGKDEIQAIIDEDHGAEVTCQFCTKHYDFSQADLEEIINANG
ncbi:Hsp33 family molecular chaperone HslO [Floricoccus penangensis]|uniref:Hsp33 family molecular chaperone HslO n=1 Tax=Floricoccus penangensis TaxID=1859475 RepID=UPI0020420DF0|nr:Hsp33 family molecular chaperone HslO [Floricoccus penangensis]URZ87562.1 Hsp33 family molecular chaperone HslO [Floricoccus penangensis]